MGMHQAYGLCLQKKKSMSDAIKDSTEQRYLGEWEPNGQCRGVITSRHVMSDEREQKQKAAPSLQ
jgi:hypothetical protein